jgi:hypothetical protein
MSGALAMYPKYSSQATLYIHEDVDGWNEQ